MSIRVPLAALAAGVRILDAKSAHYLVRVLRLRAGDAFEAFDAGLECDGEVVHEDGETVTVRLGAPRPARLHATRAITWIHGLPKGDKTSAIVQDATELGATVVVFVETARSVVRLEPHKRTERAARLQKVGEEAARQCGRGDVPRVLIANSLDEALALAPGDAARFTLYEGAKRPLRDLLPAEGSLAFFVGPEGGLEASEVAAAESRGFESVSLGAFVLRTETVPAAVLGAIRILG